MHANLSITKEQCISIDISMYFYMYIITQKSLLDANINKKHAIFSRVLHIYDKK